MLKDRINGYAVVRYKWVLLSKMIIMCIIAAVALAVAYEMKGLIKSANADYQAAPGASSIVADMQRDMKAVVVKWMKNNSEMPEQILSNIYDAAVDNINPDLILAVCLVESNFNPYVKSKKGAMGLMGIVPDVWLEDLKTRGYVQEKRDLYLIQNNIASGAYVLQIYLSANKSLEQALSGYAGGDSVYADKVLKALGEIYRVKGTTDAREAVDK